MPQVIASAVISVAAGYAARALMPQPDATIPVARTVVESPTMPGGVKASARPRDVSLKQSLPPRRLVYGEVTTGGFYFLQEVSSPWLYIGLGLCDGPIDDVSRMWIEGKSYTMPAVSGELVSAAPYTSAKLTLDKALGTGTQAVSSTLSAGVVGLPATFQQLRVARVGLKMNYGTSGDEHAKLWGSGINPLFTVRGSKVYDPRAPGQSASDQATWVYSTNAALCALHFMTSCWGRALPVSAIDLTSVATAAAICDQPIDDDGTARYTVAGLALADAPVAQTLADLLSAMGGAVTYSGGQYKVIADAPRTSVLTVADDDVVSGFEIQHDAAIDDRVSSVKAMYFSGDGNSQLTTSQSVAVSDGGPADLLPVEMTVELPFTKAETAARRLAYMAAVKRRARRTSTLHLSDVAAFLEPLDVITIVFANAPEANGVFEVLAVDVAEVGFIVNVREYAALAYTSPDDYL